MSVCTGCHKDKPDSDFHWKIKNVKRKTRCAECVTAWQREHYQNNRQKYIDKSKRWKEANETPLQRRQKAYGLTNEEWNTLVDKYDGMCWLCQESPGTVIDHDHSCCGPKRSCGKCVRGYLCQKCNSGLGFLGDNLERLKRAVEYLENGLN